MATTRGKIMENCERCAGELIFVEETFPYTPDHLMCEKCDSTYTIPYQPERSKREDSCKHEWGSEELYDSSDSFYKCNKCGHEMRCSEHCGNTVREVQ
jgi:hypothetical protein